MVEDSFYLAMDVARIIRDADGEVAGPFHSARDALKALVQSPPDSALPDVKLGEVATARMAAVQLRIAAGSLPAPFMKAVPGRATPPPPIR